MQSFEQHLSELVKAGVISVETARAAASNPADVERNLAFEEAVTGSTRWPCCRCLR
jgi:twitching motility protein PilT